MPAPMNKAKQQITRILSYASGHSEFILALSLLFVVRYLCTFISDSTPYLLQDIRSSFNLTNERLILIKSIPWAAGISVALLAGNLCSAFGTKRILTIGLSLNGIAALLIYFSKSSAMLMPGLALLGFAGSISTIAGYNLIGNFKLTPKSIAMLVGIWSFSGNLGYVTSPLISSMILADISNSRQAISVAWLMFTTLAILLLSPYRDKAEKTANDVDYVLLILAGLCFSLGASLPLINALTPSIFPLILACNAILIALTISFAKNSLYFKRQMGFIANPVIVLGLTALAANNFVDWNYLSERFLALRYSLQLSEIAVWLTPSNLAGLAGAGLFSLLSLRVGVKKIIFFGISGCLIIALLYAHININTSLFNISMAIAVYVLFDTIIDNGITASVINFVPNNLLANFEASSMILNTIAGCIGAAFSSRVVFNTFQNHLFDKLIPLPLGNSETTFIAELITQGRRSFVLQHGFGLSSYHLKSFLHRSALPSLEAAIAGFHMLGWLCLASLIITSCLYFACVIVNNKRRAAPGNYISILDR